MKKVKAKDFDDAFDRGEDVTKFLDKLKVRRVNAELKRVNIDFLSGLSIALINNLVA